MYRFLIIAFLSIMIDFLAFVAKTSFAQAHINLGVIVNPMYLYAETVSMRIPLKYHTSFSLRNPPFLKHHNFNSCPFCFLFY